ncbi:MAG: imidazolonepropionase [Thermoanaerobaculia bacterium]
MPELLIHNLAELATPLGSRPLRGVAQGRIERIPDAEILCRDGRIVFAGSRAERERLHGALSDTPRLDGDRGTAVPGFVDAHTHLPWAGSREDELLERLQGRSYQEIAAAGGGILATVRATREASVETLSGLIVRRLDWMLASGTTTAEAKSGYGLSLADELKQLRAVRAVSAAQPVELVPTLLAAHEIPLEHRPPRGERSAYLDLVCEEIVPAAAEQGLARFCDVFCEQGVFSAAESRRVLTAGVRHGLLPRLHADEFADSGGAELAAELGAFSADHLMAVSDRGIEALAASEVIALLLPGTSFFLAKKVYAPARRLIAAGIPVALATDCNPGSSYTESLPTIAQLAVFELGMTIEETLTAMTLHPACSLGLGETVGTIEAGKQADIVLLDAPNLRHLAYHYGVPPVRSVVKRGREVYRRGNLAAPQPPSADANGRQTRRDP